MWNTNKIKCDVKIFVLVNNHLKKTTYHDWVEVA